MTGEKVSWNGRVVLPGETEIPFTELLTAHFVYQRVHTLGGNILHAAEHLELVRHTFRYIYGFQPDFDETEIAESVRTLLRANRYPPKGSATVLLCFFPHDVTTDTLIMCERPLIEQGYAVSSLRPKAVSYDYRIPYGAFQTNFQLSATRLYNALALEHGATKSIRREGDRLISCGESPLFGIQGKTLFTAPLTEGAIESVERHMVISAAGKSGLHFLEEAVPHSELRQFDELFYADAAGITSLSECDGAKFMSLIVNRIIKTMN